MEAPITVYSLLITRFSLLITLSAHNPHRIHISNRPCWLNQG